MDKTSYLSYTDSNTEYHTIDLDKPELQAPELSELERLLAPFRFTNEESAAFAKIEHPFDELQEPLDDALGDLDYLLRPPQRNVFLRAIYHGAGTLACAGLGLLAGAYFCETGNGMVTSLMGSASLGMFIDGLRETGREAERWVRGVFIPTRLYVLKHRVEGWKESGAQEITSLGAELFAHPKGHTPTPLSRREADHYVSGERKLRGLVDFVDACPDHYFASPDDLKERLGR